MKVLLIGTGTMGTGIAQVLISCPEVTEVSVYSRASGNGNKLKLACKKNLQRLQSKGIISQENIDLFLSKLYLVNEFQVAVESDFIIEAVSECYKVKGKVLGEISKYVREDTIVASNTSSLSITELASSLPYPSNFVGVHFFNPAPVMELVEVIAGAVTSDEVVSKVSSFISTLKKKTVFVEEAPGFIVNRMLIPMLNEAITILAEGVASRDDIDKAMLLGARHPMGPLKLSDFIGNDVVLSIMDVIYKETGDGKYRAHPLLRKMVRADHLGVKTNKGFYEYNHAKH